MSKLMRSNKNFGRCRAVGHGQDCCVSEDIQSEFIPRSMDKYLHIKEELDLMEQQDPKCEDCDNLAIGECCICRKIVCPLCSTHDWSGLECTEC